MVLQQLQQTDGGAAAHDGPDQRGSRNSSDLRAHPPDSLSNRRVGHAPQRRFVLHARDIIRTMDRIGLLDEIPVKSLIEIRRKMKGKLTLSPC